MELTLQGITLLVIFGTLLAIIYALRVLVLMERRVARMEYHIENIANKIMKEELRIEKSLKRKRR